MNHIKKYVKTLMPSEDSKILEFSQYSKSDKDPLIIDIIESYSGRHFPVMKKGNQFVTD